jgi:hypothetical protein
MLAPRPAPILPPSARPAPIQAKPGPILPSSRPAAVQPSAGNAFAVPSTFAFKPKALGRRLPDAVQQKIEAFFQADFSDVRVHVGPEASSIGALAFTHGTDLYFGPGQYAPETPQGQRLLGHELTHVVQQRAGRVRNPLGSGVAVIQDPALEAEAERMGIRAATSLAQVQAKLAGLGPAALSAGGPSFRPAGIIVPSARKQPTGAVPAVILPSRGLTRSTIQRMESSTLRQRGKAQSGEEKKQISSSGDAVLDHLINHIGEAQVADLKGGAMVVVEDDGFLFQILKELADSTPSKSYQRPSSHFPEWAGFKSDQALGHDLPEKAGTILFGKSSRERVSKRAWAMSFFGQVSTKEYYGVFSWYQTEGAGLASLVDSLWHTLHATAHFASALAHTPLQFGMSGTSFSSEKTGNEQYFLKDE